MTIAVDPADDAVPIQAPAPITDVRDAAVAFSLSNISLEASRSLLKRLQENRRKRIQEQVTADIERTRGAEKLAAEKLERARAEHVVALGRLRAKNELEERKRRLGDVIRQKRHDLEAKKIAAEIDALDAERAESMERLGRDRKLRHESELADWKEHAEERKEQAKQLTEMRDQLAEEAKEVRDTAAQRMNRWMTRTAAGFLIWAGYTVIGATGFAVSALLDVSQGPSLLTDIGLAAMRLMTDFNRGPLHPLIAAPLSLLAFLATVVGLVVSIDALMRWFDKRWLERRRPSSPEHFVFPHKEEISRHTFSRVLVAVPFIYLSGVIIAFIAYGGHVTSNTLLIGSRSTLLNAIIGSALSLLSTSIFILYFANILEPRAAEEGWRWGTRWEVGVVPFVMLLALALVAAFGPHSRWAWAGLSAFMLLGAMALAYGLLYRGMFGEIDYAGRAVIDCDRRIAETLEAPEIDDPDRTERREIDNVLSDFRARRQYLLDLDRERRLRRVFLTSDENDPTLIAVYHIASSFLRKVWVRMRRIGPQPDFYRVTDFEAAKEETEQRQDAEQHIRELDLELSVVDPEAARVRWDACETDFAKAQQERERAERSQSLVLAETDERESAESFDFERAYALGLSTKTAYDAIVKRRDEAVTKAEKPRVKRPARVGHAEEVHSGH